MLLPAVLLLLSPPLATAAERATGTPVVWDCYLPESSVDCGVLSARYFSASFRPAPDPTLASLRVVVRSRQVIDGVNRSDEYEIRVDDLTVPGRSTSLVEQVPVSLDGNVVMERLINRLWTASLTHLRIVVVEEEEPGTWTLEVADPSDDDPADSPKGDRRSSPWYVSPYVYGYGNWSASSVDISVGGGLNVNWSVPQWRLRYGLDGSYGYQRVRYESINDAFTQYAAETSILWVRTLKNRWSAALIPWVGTDRGTANLDLDTGAALGVEYNLFPFQTGSSQGNVNVNYVVALQYMDFTEENVQGRMNALFGSHLLQVGLDWHFDPADISMYVEGEMNLNQPEFSTVEVYFDIDFRLSQAVSLSPWASFSFQNAQINEPLSAIGGTLAELQAAGEWNELQVDGGLTFSVVFGNAQLENNDQRWSSF